MGAPPILLWFRRDLRLSDNPMLAAAVATGRPLIPLFIHDDAVADLGAAPKWRLGLGVAEFAVSLTSKGSFLTLRKGAAGAVIEDLVAQTGATDVWWSRLYDPLSRARDADIKARLRSVGISARSFPGHLLFEPWTVETGQGGIYRVYSPFWRAVKDRDVPVPELAPKALPAPREWPASDRLEAWGMGRAMNRGAAVVSAHVCTGETAALGRLGGFIAQKVGAYKTRRDFPAENATSNLSENLTYGEIGPRTIWHAGFRAMQEGAQGAEHFLKELVWREFAWHLMYHTPEIGHRNWRPEWESFPWSQGEGDAVLRWKQGRTGVPFVDAAMREMYVTGTMHNRARMIVASYLTKHMLTHWKVGMDWFADCLIDWDPAANAMGWQWVAGSGPDAAPYFRIFNPETQAARFDPDSIYLRRFIAEGAASPDPLALSYFDAVPESWGLAPSDPYPEPVVGLKEGRDRALRAFGKRKA